MYLKVDATLKEDGFKEILIDKGCIFPGKALSKKLPPIGDISIKGVIGDGGEFNDTHFFIYFVAPSTIEDLCFKTIPYLKGLY